MAGKPKPADERRSNKVPVQLTDDEYSRIADAANTLDVSFAEVLRSGGLTRADDVRRTAIAINPRQLALPVAASAPKLARRRGRKAIG